MKTALGMMVDPPTDAETEAGAGAGAPEEAGE